MEAYLQDMASQGWYLKWCKSVLAGFERRDDPPAQYAVDPLAVTAPNHLRRYPRVRLDACLKAGWIPVGKSKGCQILSAKSPDAQHPVPDQELRPQIRNTCRLGSLLVVLLLLGLGYFLLRQPAVAYTVVLTNLYLVIGVIAAFLMLYHAVNFLVLLIPMPDKPRSNPRLCKRYLFRSAMLLFLLLAAIVVMLGGRNDMMMYLLLPILAIVVGVVVLKVLSKRVDASRLGPAVIVISLVLFGLMIFGNRAMSASNTQWASQRQEVLLENAGQLPVLHLSDFGDTSEAHNAVQVNQSVLGENLLYAEQSETGYVFTNYTETRAPFLSDIIFRYLYLQGQTDFGESFVEKTEDGVTYYALETANTYLLQQDTSVYFCTFPSEADPAEMFQLLFSREAAIAS